MATRTATTPPLPTKGKPEFGALAAVAVLAALARVRRFRSCPSSGLSVPEVAVSVPDVVVNRFDRDVAPFVARSVFDWFARTVDQLCAAMAPRSSRR